MKTKGELKIWISAMVFMALISISVFVGSASANTIYVPDNHAKIQWAVDNATDGDTIVVRDGTFAREDIIFKSSIITYSKDMKFGSVKRKLIDAKNRGIVGTQRHFFDKRALERDITPREIGEVIDSCVLLEEQNHDKYPKLRYKIKGETSFGKKLMLVVS